VLRPCLDCYNVKMGSKTRATTQIKKGAAEAHA
jgi:hypothetical protein